MRLLIFLAFLTASPALAQTVCQGGTSAFPACARNWATTPLSVQACPATATTSDGTRVVLRETSGAPLLSVTAAVPGGTVTLATSSAPRVPAGAPASRVIEFTCENAQGQGGAATFATITFPILGPPQAPVLHP